KGEASRGSGTEDSGDNILLHLLLIGRWCIHRECCRRPGWQAPRPALINVTGFGTFFFDGKVLWRSGGGPSAGRPDGLALRVARANGTAKAAGPPAREPSPCRLVLPPCRTGYPTLPWSPVLIQASARRSPTPLPPRA